MHRSFSPEMNWQSLFNPNLCGASGALLLPLLFSGCDNLTLGYVNKPRHPITIVEHGWDSPPPMRLRPGQVVQPWFGPLPASIDVLSASGKLLAHYRTRDIPEIGPRHGLEYIVIDSKGVVIDGEGSYKNGNSNSIKR